MDWDHDSDVSLFVAIRFIFLALHFINLLLDWLEKPNFSLLLSRSGRYFNRLFEKPNWNFGNSCLAFSSRRLEVIWTYFKNCWLEIALFKILIMVGLALILDYSVIIYLWDTDSWLVQHFLNGPHMTIGVRSFRSHATASIFTIQAWLKIRNILLVNRF